MTKDDPRQFNEVGREQLRRLWSAVYGGDVPASASTLFDSNGPAGDHLVGLAVRYQRRSYPLRVFAPPRPGRSRASYHGRGPPRAAKTCVARTHDARGPGIEPTARAGVRREPEPPREGRGSRSSPRSPAVCSPCGMQRSWIRGARSRLQGLPEPACARKGARPPRRRRNALPPGLPGVWPVIAQAARRGPMLDEILYVSLDLGDSPHARVKVYIAHQDATFADLRHVASLAPGHDASTMDRFLRVVANGEGILRADRPAVTCLAFVAGKPRARGRARFISPCARTRATMRSRIGVFFRRPPISASPADLTSAPWRRSRVVPCASGAGFFRGWACGRAPRTRA